MGNSEAAIKAIQDALSVQQRSYLWLSREAGLPYKRLLAEVKHSTRRLSLETTCGAANVLRIDLVSVLTTIPSIERNEEDAAA